MELEHIAINDFGISGYTLMKRAAQATFDSIIKTYPDIQSICVVCESGNNGGDGYVIATLAIEAGFIVNLIQLGSTKSIKADALIARKAYLQVKGKEAVYNPKLLKTDLIVDAIFGTGLSRDVSGKWATVIEAINTSSAKVVAVDIPSGLNAYTGRIHRVAVKADITVTYIGLKRGLFTGQARDYCGTVYFDDLLVPEGVYTKLNNKSNVQLIPENFLQQVLIPRRRSSHKGNHGHVLFVGGAQGMSGAIRLAAEASLRTGTGLVSIATDPKHADVINLTRPELMVTGIQHALELLPLIEKANIIVIGPGLGKSEWAKKLLQKVLESNKPKLLDADALNLLSDLSPKYLIDQNWILTPHPAEAACLLGITTIEIEADRYQSIKKLVKKWGGGCILKGAGSLISDGLYTKVCIAGNPGMASGGMGDVLSGIVASLMAQGLNLLDAASAGTLLHAQAADLAAQKGERGMLASDLFPFIRELLNQKQYKEE